VASPLAPGESEVLTFLKGLRKHRGTLSGPAQALLDSLVAAGLGRTVYQAPEDGIKRLWSAYAGGPFSRSDSLGGPYGPDVESWETTPWGQACRSRYC